MIRAEQLTKEFRNGVAAISGVTLEIAKGESVAVVGPPGAGKSTLLALLAAMLKPTSGSLRVGDIDAVREPIAARRRICWPAIPDAAAATIAEYLDLIARLRGLDGALVSTALDRTGLAGGRRMRHLTSPERATLAIATAIVADADITIVDAPFAGADATVRLWREVLRERRAAGVTTLLSADPAVDVSRSSDRILSLDRGRLIEARPVRRVTPDTAWQAIRA